jgi:hypothetical protein
MIGCMPWPLAAGPLHLHRLELSNPGPSPLVWKSLSSFVRLRRPYGGMLV